jgi:hypothetical protein
MKITFNPAIKGASGSMGEWVYYTLAGKPVARRKAKFVDARSPNQLAHRERVRKAAAWSRETMADPDLKAEYRKACQGHQTPYNVGLRDYLTPPVVEAINVDDYQGKAGNVVKVKAWDDFQVVAVSIVMKDADGKVLEQGPAQLDNDLNEWQYVAKTNMAAGKAVLVEATALDRPGNKGESSRWQYLP